MNEETEQLIFVEPLISLATFCSVSLCWEQEELLSSGCERAEVTAGEGTRNAVSSQDFQRLLGENATTKA